MRDVGHRRYEEESFASAKLVATLYLALFVFIIGMGVQAQLSGFAPSTASSAAFEAASK